MLQAATVENGRDLTPDPGLLARGLWALHSGQRSMHDHWSDGCGETAIMALRFCA